MAVALLGLQGSGGASAWPRLQRVINATASALGESFGTITLTGAPSGAFTVGETLSFSGGGTATLTQGYAASPHRIIVASPSGVISGTITGLSSGVTAAVSTLEGAFTHPSADTNQYTSPVVEFSNRVFCLHGNTVYRLNESLGVSGGRCEEVFRLITTRAVYLSDSATNGGMYVVYVGGIATLLAFYTSNGGSGGVVRLLTMDGVSWLSADIVSGNPYFSISSAGPGIVFNNNIYWVGTSAPGINAIYDSATDTFSGGPSSPSAGFTARRSVIFAWDNRLFSINDNGSNNVVCELIAGTWTAVNFLPTAGASSRMFAIPGNDGAMYVAVNFTLGFRMYRFGLGSTIEVTRGVLPFGLYNGSGAVTNGWCTEVFTDKEFNEATVDNGPSESFLYVSTNDSSGTNRSCYKWTDDIAHQHPDARLLAVFALPANTAAGSGVGKTLTANINGPLTVDSVTVNLNNRVMVIAEASGANNGIYVCTDPGSGGSPWILTRATDFDSVSSTEVDTGAWAFITEGTTYTGFRIAVSTAGPITLETTALTFVGLPILVLEDSGCPQQIRIPSSTYSGGEYSFSPGGLDIRITNVLPIPGGERISYRIYKTPGAADVTSLKVRFEYRLATDDTYGRLPGRWGYIGATSVGSITVGNREITGLTANSEQGSGVGTVYTLDWMALSQDLLSNYLPVGRKLSVYP